ncbi:porin family protein [Vibrio europaeus]|uniref:porin family protein n=1 Tax=Vibrio europaeus TaxID=300876 RepID=UPI00233EF87B|nr:porin family protein [Vibrio europaeus]MDC5818429.1 porin family protein [Vibrio europaeus]MDC5839364.1 porin family protein [Vibrio europaeus]MDC5871568.1 porin family protein [Vibrio europaeus]
MKKVLSVAAVALALSATAAQAHEGLYVGGSYQAADFKSDVKDSNKAKAHMFNLVTGYDFNQYFGVEGRVGVPVSSEKTSSGEYNIKGKPTTSYAVFAKGMFPINDMFSVYGLAGYGKSGYKVDYNLPTNFGGKGSVKAEEGSLQYAAGVEFNFTQNIAMTAEYGVYGYGKEKIGSKEAKWDNKGFNIGVKYKF